jgi:hypothetical protein
LPRKINRGVYREVTWIGLKILTFYDMLTKSIFLIHITGSKITHLESKCHNDVFSFLTVNKHILQSKVQNDLGSIWHVVALLQQLRYLYIIQTVIGFHKKNRNNCLLTGSF